MSGGTRRPVLYTGPVVHHEEDEHGPIDVVEESDGKLRSLHFGSSARQSTMFVARPAELALEYTRCMMTSLLFLPQDPQRALMLGLGGGSLVKFLLHECATCRVHVAELRARVVAVAQRFFDLPEDHPRLQIDVGDGSAFVQEHPGPPWDLIFVDLHSRDGMAPAVFEPGFIPALRRHLSDDGVMAANLWYGIDEDREKDIRERLEAQFARILYLPVAGKRNCIALGLPAARIPAASVLQTRARAWRTRAEVPLPELLVELLRHNHLSRATSA